MPDAPGVPSAQELAVLPHGELAAQLAEAYQVIAGVTVRVQELAAGCERLVARVEGLERRAGKDSSTSSRPPPSDSRYEKKSPRDRSLRERGKRRPGKQPGEPVVVQPITPRITTAHSSTLDSLHKLTALREGNLLAPFSLVGRLEPWIIFAAERDLPDPRSLDEFRQHGGVILHLDASQWDDSRYVFAAFAVEFAFPGYFGWNWDALVDCLGDPHGPWHGRKNVTVVIKNADALLGKQFFPLLISVLCQAAKRANLQLDSDGLPTGIPVIAEHFIFQVMDVPVGRFAEALNGAGGVILEAEAPYLLVKSDMD